MNDSLELVIDTIVAREVLDSRGNPTVEAEVFLEGVAMKPEFNLSDGIHPNEKGTIIMSRTLEETIIKTYNKKN